MPTKPRSPRLLVIAAGGALLLLALLVLLVLARGGAPLPLDRTLLTSLRLGADPARPVGPRWLAIVMRDLTALGDGVILTSVVVVAAGLLLVLRKGRTAALLVAATWSGSVLAAEAKLWVGRARPESAARLVEVGGLSFPSGHATNSAIVYLTLASLATHVERGRAVRTYTLAVAGLLVALIGASRVFLGVHWASDVLAGWCAGFLWALGWWWVGARLRLQ